MAKAYDLKITRGGQISIPAEIRRRWGTSSLRAVESGDTLLITPAVTLEESLQHFKNMLRLPKDFDLDAAQRQIDEEDTEAEGRKWREFRK